MLKKIISVLFATALFVFSNFICYAETITKDIEVDVPPSMLVLGDSIASGYALEGYDKNNRENCQSYANILADEYSEELSNTYDFSMENLAIDGQTSVTLLEDLQNGKYDDNMKDVSCILLSIGGNDILGAFRKTINNTKDIIMNNDKIDLSAIGTNIKQLNATLDENLAIYDKNVHEIAKIINEKSDAVLIIQTLYNPFENITGLQSFADEKIGELNEKIKSHANDEGAEYIVCDVAPAFVGKANDLTRIKLQDIHPTASGHEVISEQLDKTIRAQKFYYQEVYVIPEPPVVAQEVLDKADRQAIEASAKLSLNTESTVTSEKETNITKTIILSGLGATIIGIIIVAILIIKNKEKKQR